MDRQALLEELEVLKRLRQAINEMLQDRKHTSSKQALGYLKYLNDLKIRNIELKLESVNA